MTAFALFQRATCLISEGDRAGAARCLRRAVAWIDRTGRDAELRDDLMALAVQCEATHAT